MDSNEPQSFVQQQIRIEGIERSPCKPRSKRSKQKRAWVVDLRRTHYKILKEVVEKELHWKILKEGNESDPNIIWSDFYVSEDQVNNLLPFQKINHFPSSFQLGNKTFLTKNIGKMKKKYRQQYMFLPDSWQLPEELEFFKRQKDKKKGSMWILKPANLCQGKGIIITGNIDLIEEKVRQTKKQFVVQRYIQNPYLLDGLKFDLRLYVMVRSLKPLEIYLYRDGLARFATNNYEKPSKSNVLDSFMHLTNFAINKKNPVFCDQEETGHKRRFSSVLEILLLQGRDINLLMFKIVQAIVCTIVSVQPKLSHLYQTSAPSKFAKGKNCFEIFGFDFLIDESMNPYLLEVNHTPSFRISSEVDREVKKNLLKNTLYLLFSKAQRDTWHKHYVWETKDSLSYLQIYPTKDEVDPYKEIISHSQMLYDCWTGVKKEKKEDRYNHQKQILTEPQSPEPKQSFSTSKPQRPFRPFTAQSGMNSQNRSLHKTTSSVETPFQFKTMKIIPNRLVKPLQKRTMSAITKKHSTNSVQSKGEDKKLACIVYDFMQRNIGFMEPDSKDSRTCKQTKKILWRSFNSKQYKNVRSKGFHESFKTNGD